MARKVILSLVGFLFLGFGAAIAQEQSDFVVIVNPENPVKTMSYTEVADAFLTKNTSWPDHEEFLPVNLESTSSLRADFSKTILEKSVAAVDAFVNRQLFSGRAKPPLVVKTEAEVIDFVRKNKGAIGYVSSSAQLDGVRALSLMVPPRKIRTVSPRLPPGARVSGVHGTVILDVVVDTQGDVTGVEEVKGLSHGLTQAAIAAVRKWKFEPARIAGQPTEATVRIAVRFN